MAKQRRDTNEERKNMTSVTNVIIHSSEPPRLFASAWAPGYWAIEDARVRVCGASRAGAAAAGASAGTTALADSDVVVASTLVPA